MTLVAGDADARGRVNGRGLPIAWTGPHVNESLLPHVRLDRVASVGDCQNEDDDRSDQDGGVEHTSIAKGTSRLIHGEKSVAEHCCR